MTTGISAIWNSWLTRLWLALVLTLGVALATLASGPNRTAFAVTLPAPSPTTLVGSPTCAEVFDQFFPGSTGIIEIDIGDQGGTTFTGSASGATVVGTLDDNRITITSFTLTAPSGQQINDALVVIHGRSGSSNAYPYPAVLDATLTSSGLTTPDGQANAGKSFCLTTESPTAYTHAHEHGNEHANADKYEHPDANCNENTNTDADPDKYTYPDG